MQILKLLSINLKSLKTVKLQIDNNAKLFISYWFARILNNNLSMSFPNYNRYVR